MLAKRPAVGMIRTNPNGYKITQLQSKSKEIKRWTDTYILVQTIHNGEKNQANKSKVENAIIKTIIKICCKRKYRNHSHRSKPNKKQNQIMWLDIKMIRRILPFAFVALHSSWKQVRCEETFPLTITHLTIKSKINLKI